MYYCGERCASDNPQSLTCPYCGEMGYSFPYLNESSALTNQTENVDLFQHVQSKHGADQQLPEVICPICAAMINGEPNLVTGDLISHIANDHQQSQSNTPSSTNEGMNAYSRPVLPNREYDFGIGAAIRGGFRRGSSRVPSRRGGGGGTTRGGGSSNGSAGQHFIVDTTGFSPNAHGNDPIADLLTQLSNVRRMAAANNNNNSNNTNSNTLSVTPNTINLQTLTRQQYERERLRAALSRSHQHYQSSNSPQSSGTTDNVPSVETDSFDPLFSSTLHIVPSISSNAHPQQQSNDSDPSLLRRLCDQPLSAQLPKSNADFVQSLLLSSLVSGCNENDST